MKKEVRPSHTDTDHDTVYLLEFQNWSNKTDKVVEITESRYSFVEESKEYYLVFVDGYSMPDGIYPTDEYVLDL